MSIYLSIYLSGAYANDLHLASDMTTPTPHHLILVGRMLFLTLNQQCQSTEGIPFINIVA